MHQVLQQIAERAAEDNPWLGERPLQQARERLAGLPEADGIERFRALLLVAEQELRLGLEDAAIGHFRAACDLASAAAGMLDPMAVARAHYRLGVAYLRQAESQNCAASPAAESCLLPLRGDGIHRAPGSTLLAIAELERVFALAPSDSPLFVETVWLLNLAHMALGDYPAGVPDRYRVPPRIFESARPFLELPNVAPSAGIVTHDLSGGAAVDDFDGDGDLDVLTTTLDTSGAPHYFRNRGDGTFEEATASAELDGMYGGLNLVHADFDNDGDLDVLVLRGAWFYGAGRHPNSLWRNDGSGRFTDVTYAAGLAEPALPTQTAAWADVDGDGDLDLFVGNEHGRYEGIGGAGTVVSEPFDAPSQLFRNRGDGTFEEVAAAAGVAVRAYVKAAVWGDIDNDGDPDLYLSVLGGPNHLFRNDSRAGDLAFTEITVGAGVEGPISSFPAWFWDYDNDGNLDLYVSSYAAGPDSVALVAASAFGLAVPFERARLYHGDGSGRFEDRAPALGLDRIVLAMGANFGDLDGDGWPDFYLGTGYPDYEALMPNVLYHNEAGRGFIDVTWAARVGHLQKGHAVSFADVDGDGDLDLFEQMGGGFPGDRFTDVLYRNPGFGNHFLAVEAVGVRSNRSAIGVRLRVDVAAPSGPRTVRGVVGTGGSFGDNPLRQTLGLGDAAGTARLEVFWPTSGRRQVFKELPLDVAVRLMEPTDDSTAAPSLGGGVRPAP